MSKESARGFLKRMKSDELFASQIAEADFEERRKLAKDAGFDFTKDEIDEVASDELSSDELKSVSGGRMSRVKLDVGPISRRMPNTGRIESAVDQNLAAGIGEANYGGQCYGRLYGCTNGCEGVSLW